MKLSGPINKIRCVIFLMIVPFMSMNLNAQYSLFSDVKAKKVGDIITTRIFEVLKTGVKVAIDQEKKLIVTIKKIDLAKDSVDARPEVFSKNNALDAKITELDLSNRKIKLSVRAAQIDEEKSLIAKFGEGATKSGATLKGIFEKAIGKKGKKEK